MSSPVCHYERQCLAEVDAEGVSTSDKHEGRPATGRRLVPGTAAVAAAIVIACCFAAQQRSSASAVEPVAIHSRGTQNLIVAAANDKVSLSTLMCEIDIN